MAEILTDFELRNLVFAVPMSRPDRDRILLSHRALAAERDNLKEVNQGIIDGIKDGKAILGERIRTLESACEAALTHLKILEHDMPVAGYEQRRDLIKQLEGAIKK